MSPLGGAWRKAVRASRWAVGGHSSDGWHDVWSRAGRRYRDRAIVLLVIDLLLFTGLCLFTYWLRTGQYLPLPGEEYFTLLKRSFQVSGPGQISLTDMLVGPISVERVPLQMVIIALIMAALVSVPVLVAILYRFPYSLPFAAMISLVAGLPWLGITEVFACALASLRPFRMHFRFGSAMLGLVPFGLYLWMSLKSGGEPLPSSSPMEVFKLYTPWGLSIMAAVFNFAVVLSIASIVGYRPGAIAPVLAILFAVPVVLFETRVGQDELYYSVLETQYGPGSEYFKRRSVSQFIEEQPEALDLYGRIYAQMNESLENIRVQWRMNLPAVRPLKQKVEELAILTMEQDRAEVVEQTERFVADFPKSRRVPAALYLQGRALDTQVDLSQVIKDGTIAYYDDFPSPLSHETWQELAGSYKDHPLAAAACYRLAIHALRQGRPTEALERLVQAESLAKRRKERPATPSEGWFALLMPSTAEADTLGLDVQYVALLAHELRELVEANAQDPKYGAEPLSLLYRMDPHHVRYRMNLMWLDAEFPGAALHDNLQLQLVLTHPSLSMRISQLEQHLVTYAGQDSVRQAMYELGRLLEEDARFHEAIERYDALRAQYPESVWTELASQRAATLKLSLGK